MGSATRTEGLYTQDLFVLGREGFKGGGVAPPSYPGWNAVECDLRQKNLPCLKMGVLQLMGECTRTLFARGGVMHPGVVFLPSGMYAYVYANTGGSCRACSRPYCEYCERCEKGMKVSVEV